MGGGNHPAAQAGLPPGSGSHLQIEPEEADYKSKIYEAVCSGFCPASSLEQRVLALCRLLKKKARRCCQAI
jgi:hypothetical protein